jgi:hypothetical protein
MAISTIGASALDSGVSQLGKNLIDNGAMTVAQRGTLTGQGPNNEYTGLDRFAIEANGSIQARFTTSQDTDVPAGAGFGYSLKVDCTTAEVTVASADGCLIAQRIEAQNLQHLDYGAAGAKTLVASFWMKSPKSGTHCVSLDQPDGGSTYIREFTVASADTWEKHTVTFPGDASGTINNDTGAGLELKFPLFMGSTYQGTADTWTGSGTQWATSNQQNLLDNTANNIYITGVQLEVGSVATDFEHEDYGTTKRKCSRYLNVESYSNDRYICAAYILSATVAAGTWRFPEMRSVPTCSVSGVTHFEIDSGGGEQVATNMSLSGSSLYTASLVMTTSGMTAGQSGIIQGGVAGPGILTASAEL